MSTSSIIMMVITCGGYLIAFGYLISLVFKPKNN